MLNALYLYAKLVKNLTKAYKPAICFAYIQISWRYNLI